MARITTDDCRTNCPNHFNLAYHVSQRAQQIMRRGDARIAEGNDRPVVVALREIARNLHPIERLSAETGDDPKIAANKE